MNELTSMLRGVDGPHFLLLYAVLAVTVIGLAWWRVRRMDTSANSDQPPLPDELGEYEVAYLRGGASEAARLAVLSLVQKGYLKVQHASDTARKGGDIVENGQHPSPERLAGVEQVVFDGIAESGKGFRNGVSSLTEAVEQHCASFKSWLNEHRLLSTPEFESTARTSRWLGATVLAGVAFGRIATALANGRTNVLGLVALGFLSLLLLFLVTRCSPLSARGRAYLESLTSKHSLEYARLDPSLPVNPATLLLLAGLFGFGLLERTGFASVNQVFREEDQRSSSGGCGGGGCGGGGGGGGGCGGGCGGCGGCG